MPLLQLCMQSGVVVGSLFLNRVTINKRWIRWRFFVLDIGIVRMSEEKANLCFLFPGFPICRRF